MEHDYSLPFAVHSVTEAVPIKCKCMGEPNDPRKLLDKKRTKTRVNIFVASPRWTELQEKLGLQRNADRACV